MITYIKGNITHKSPTYVVVEAGGIGYHINISLHTYALIEKLEAVKILTHQHIKEDSHTLYGFSESVERNLFRHLISVSGVGPSTAQLMLSSMTPDEMRASIIGEDVAGLKRIKGKLLKDGGDENLPANVQQADNTIREEALSALVALQFNRIHAQKALNKVLKAQPGIGQVEALIKLALKELS